MTAILVFAMWSITVAIIISHCWREACESDYRHLR